LIQERQPVAIHIISVQMLVSSLDLVLTFTVLIKCASVSLSLYHIQDTAHIKPFSMQYLVYEIQDTIKTHWI